jgi:hypothetical protein
MFAAAIGLALALGACAGPPPPTYTDAFQGIYNQSAASVPANVPVSVQQPVGIIFSDNVERYIGYVNDSKAYWENVVPQPLTNKVVEADADPTYFAGRILGMLKSHFPNAQVVHDFNQAVATGKKSVCLVDLRPKPMEPYGDRNTRMDVDAYFFDASMNPMSKLSGHGEHYVAFGSMDAGIQVSIDAAIRELDGKITTLVH